MSNQNQHGKATRKKNTLQIEKLVIMGIMVAIVFVLQYLGGAIAIPGTGLSITLTLIPIVLGAILYGPVFGSVLGLVFGGVVAMSVLQGTAGVLSADMLANRPVFTIFLCLFKGFAAGLVPGLIAKAIRKKNLYLGVILAAVSAPVVNTSIFSVGLLAFYGDIAASYAGTASVLTFLIVGIVGINFLIEFAANLIAAPILVRVIQALKKSGILKIVF